MMSYKLLHLKLNLKCIQLHNLYLLVYCIILILALAAVDAQNLDKTSRKSAFCGRRLTTILGQFCLEYPTRDTDYLHRSKRQIINECCQNKCSLNYLLDNYCQTINTEALEAFKKADDESREGEIHRPTTQITLSRRYRQKNNLENVNYEYINADKGEKTHRKRRNCGCKKYHKLKKARREHRLWRMLVNKNFTNQEPQIGHIEERQTPLYIIT